MLRKFLNEEHQIQIIEEIVNFFHSNYLLSEEEKLFNLEEVSSNQNFLTLCLNEIAKLCIKSTFYYS